MINNEQFPSIETCTFKSSEDYSCFDVCIKTIESKNMGVFKNSIIMLNLIEKLEDMVKNEDKIKNPKTLKEIENHKGYLESNFVQYLKDKNRNEQIKKRIDLTFKRFKERKLYKETLYDLLYKSDSLINTLTKQKFDVDKIDIFMTLILNIIEFNSSFIGLKTEISDKTWKEAIELGTLLYSMDIVADPEKESYAPTLKGSIGYIYFSVFFLHILEILKFGIKEVSKNRNLKKETNKKTKLNGRYVKSSVLPKLKEEKETLETKLKEENNKRIKLEKELRLLHYKVEKLEIEIKEEKNKKPEQQDLNILISKEEFTEEMKDDLLFIESNNNDYQSEELEDIILPEENVIFLGGHNKFLDKVRELHPKWTIINDDAYNNKVPDNTTLVIEKVEYLSHRLEWTVIGQLKGDYDIIFVDATNINRAEQIIKTEYKKILEKRKEKKNDEHN